MGEACLQAFCSVFGSAEVLAVVVAAAVYGVFVGAVPGLTATMAVALFVPMTFWLDSVSALAAIVTMSTCAIFAGDIPATLLRIPGTPASAAYVDDAYGFTCRGRPERALGTALVCSVAGGLFGAAILMLLGHQLARIATLFSVAEYFWLYLLGLTCAVVVSRGSVLRGLLGLIAGLLLSTVGLSAVHMQARFTFGQPQLYQGITFIPAMIGLFGVSELLNNLAQFDTFRTATAVPARPAPAGFPPGRWLWSHLTDSVANTLKPALRLLAARKSDAVRSGAIGTIVGMLPGAGADIAAWVAFAASKRLSRTRPDILPADDAPLAGVADATTANSAALAGAWIPALVFGIPGDSITAIVIGVLLMKNIKPGPEVFRDQAAIVYSIYFTFILANLIMIPVGLAATRLAGHIVRVPRRVLLPAILLFCVVGAFALNGSTFDIWLMLVMGMVGFAFERHNVPLGPVVLGIILGGPLEERFVQTMTGAGGSWLGLVDRPLSATLACVCCLPWISLAVVHWRRLVP